MPLYKFLKENQFTQKTFKIFLTTDGLDNIPLVLCTKEEVLSNFEVKILLSNIDTIEFTDKTVYIKVVYEP